MIDKAKIISVLISKTLVCRNIYITSIVILTCDKIHHASLSYIFTSWRSLKFYTYDIFCRQCCDLVRLRFNAIYQTLNALSTQYIDGLIMIARHDIWNIHVIYQLVAIGRILLILFCRKPNSFGRSFYLWRGSYHNLIQFFVSHHRYEQVCYGFGRAHNRYAF